MTSDQIDELRTEVMQALYDACLRSKVELPHLSAAFGVGVCIGGLIWSTRDDSRQRLVQELREKQAEFERMGRGGNV